MGLGAMITTTSGSPRGAPVEGFSLLLQRSSPAVAKLSAVSDSALFFRFSLPEADRDCPRCSGYSSFVRDDALIRSESHPGFVCGECGGVCGFVCFHLGEYPAVPYGVVVYVHLFLRLVLADERVFPGETGAVWHDGDCFGPLGLWHHSHAFLRSPLRSTAASATPSI